MKYAYERIKISRISEQIVANNLSVEYLKCLPCSRKKNSIQISMFFKSTHNQQINLMPIRVIFHPWQVVSQIQYDTHRSIMAEEEGIIEIDKTNIPKKLKAEEWSINDADLKDICAPMQANERVHVELQTEDFVKIFKLEVKELEFDRPSLHIVRYRIEDDDIDEVPVECIPSKDVITDDNESNYVDCDVIVPDFTPTTLEQTDALIEKAMQRMEVTTFEDLCRKINKDK
jgi:hypothetical protein